MNEFFRIDHDPATGIVELVLNRPDRMNTTAVFEPLGEIAKP